MNPKKLSAKTRYIICIILMWIGHILGFTGLLIRDNDSFGVSLYMTIIFLLLLIYFVIKFVQYCNQMKRKQR